MDSRLRRRDVLQGLTAVGMASMASVAGCTGLIPGSEEQRDRPSYYQYVPAERNDEGTFFITVDIEQIRDLEAQDLEGKLPEGASVDFEDPEGLGDADPMVAYPTAGLVVSVFAMAFGLVPYGFGTDLASGFGVTSPSDPGAGTPTETATTETEEPATQVDTMVMLDGAFVFDGTFDSETLTSDIEGFEPAGEWDGFEVYEGVEGESLIDTQNLAFAVAKDVLVALYGDDTDDPRGRLDAVLDTVIGDADRLSSSDDPDWALRTAGHGLVTIGGWGVDPDAMDSGSASPEDELQIESVLDGADGVVSSLGVEADQRRARADVAAVYPEDDTPSREAIEDSLGTSAPERTIEIDGTRVAVTASWPAEDATTTDTS